jgi:CBS domain-containing protein
MLKLRDIMTREVLTVPPNLSVREAAEIFSTERLGGAPVVRGGRMIGMLSASDLLDFIASLPAEPAGVGDTSERGILDDHTVEEAMTRGPVHSLPPDAPVTLAAEVMKQERIHRLPVVENETLVGIVSTVDLVKAVADRRINTRTFVFPKRGEVA